MGTFITWHRNKSMKIEYKTNTHSYKYRNIQTGKFWEHLNCYPIECADKYSLFYSTQLSRGKN